MLPQNVLYGVRRMQSNPLFSAIVVLCLAIGIGANTAIFSVVNTLLLRPLPYEDPNRIMMVWDTHAGASGEVEPFSASPANFDLWQRENKAFESLEAIQLKSYNLTKRGEPLRVEGAGVSRGFHRLFGVEPLHGRTFTPEEDRPGGLKAVILGHGLWQRQFGSDPEVVGSTVTLDDEPYTIAGIMPPGFQFPHRSEIWTPLALDPQQAPARLFHSLYVAGRLRPDVSVEQAQKEMEVIAQRLEQEFPDTNKGWGALVQPLRRWMVGDVRSFLLTLSIAVGFVLLIACVNIANMLLARATSRSGEMAVRIAMGAQRRQLLSQLLVESVMLALLGGALGVLLAHLFTGRLFALAPIEMSNFQEVTIDRYVLGATLLLSIVTGLLFGLFPALKSLRPDLLTALREGGRTRTVGRSGVRLQQVLVVAEVALALLLLVGAGLMLKSLSHLREVSTGFDPRGLLTMRLTLSTVKLPEIRQRAAHLDRIAERLSALPGIESVGASTVLPGDPKRAFSYMFTVEGRPLASPGEVLIANNRLVNADFFRTMRLPLLQGREFNASDYLPDAPLVAIVSAQMARRYWPGQSPLGKHLKRGAPDAPNPWITVVGVAADVKDTGLAGETVESWYLPYSQQPFDAANLIIRTDGDPMASLADVRREILAIDPDQPIFEVASVEEVLGSSISKQRFSALLLGAFGLVGLLLAVTGIYGVMSYSVHQRFHEIGLRMALGARISDVLGLVLRQGLALTLTGVVLGVLGSLAMTGLISKLLFEVSSLDLATFLLAAVILSGAGLLASYITARKALSVNPVVVLTSG